MMNQIQIAATHAAVIVTIVEALRSKISSIDGWQVWLIAALISLALSLLFATDTTLPTLLESLRTAVLAWLMSIGGNAWVSKIASRIAGT